jgi:COMPASS component SWD3
VRLPISPGPSPTMPGTRSEDSTPRRRPSISPINSPMPLTEYSLAERPARDDSPDHGYYNLERAESRSRSRSRSPKRSSPRRTSTSYCERSPSEPLWTPPERPKEVHYKPTLVLKGHKKAISAVKFSPDGKRIASCSADGTIKIWDAFTGKHEHTLEGHMAGISTIAWSPDSTTLASGSDDKSIRLWDVIKVIV